MPEPLDALTGFAGAAAAAGGRRPALDLDLRRVEYGDPDASLLVERVQEEYVARYGGRDETPLEPAMFLPPQGSFFVGYVEGRPVASGAWRRRDDLSVLGSDRLAEVKRMYVVPSHQRRGLARRLLGHLEASAREAGAEVMVLETGLAQPEAMALYLAVGYEPVPGFGHYKDEPLSRCFGRRLV